MVCCSIFKIYFSDFCQPKYLNSYQTDLHEIFRICRTLAVVEQSEATLRSHKGCCHSNQLFADWAHTFFRHAIISETA